MSMALVFLACLLYTTGTVLTLHILDNASDVEKWKRVLLSLGWPLFWSVAVGAWAITEVLTRWRIP